MTRARRTSVIVAALAALTIPAAMAASPSSPTPTASSSSKTDAAAGIKHITVEKPFDIVLDSKGNADANKLPTPSTLFTKSELAQVLPGLTAVSVNDNTQTLTIKGDSSSTIEIVLKHFGTKDAVAKAWQHEKTAHTNRSKANPGLYTFFDGQLGASDAFTDGTNTHVLVTKGDVAGDIWFSGSGFTQLASDYPASRTAYKTKVVPALIRLIAEKLAKGVATDSHSAKPSSSSSPAA